MARVTATEVKEIMPDVSMEDAQVLPFINAAEAMINKIFANDITTGTDLLKEIERWFTAHMIASTPFYRQAYKERVGDAEITYTGEFKQDLSSTPYGQMVKTLDTTGKMSNIAKRAITTFTIPSFD